MYVGFIAPLIGMPFIIHCWLNQVDDEVSNTLPAPQTVVLPDGVMDGVGGLPTVITTVSFLLQPVADDDTVRIYVVVTVGAATGSATIAELNPVAGVHK